MKMSVGSDRVIIFDWDDTICPSSFVDKWKLETLKDLPSHFQRLFEEVGRCAEKCLNMAARHGEVIIITNSDDGWVKFSAERFVPNLLPCLERFRIISARTRYERFYPGKPLCWKAAAFAHEANEIYTAFDRIHTGDENSERVRLDSDVDSLVSSELSSPASKKRAESFSSFSPQRKKNYSTKTSFTKQHRRLAKKEVISFGDSMEERTAVKIVANQLDAVPKSVMFINSPSPVQIIGQLDMLTNHMDFVCDHDSILDLEISPDQASKTAETFLRKRNYDVAKNVYGSNYVSRIKRQASPNSTIDVLHHPLSN